MLISKKTTETYLSATDFFRFPRIALRIFGIWPMDDGRLPIRFYINFTSLFCAAIFGMAHGFANLDHLLLALETLCGCMFEFVSWCKVLIVWYHLEKFTRLLTILLQYFKSGEANAICFLCIEWNLFYDFEMSYTIRSWRKGSWNLSKSCETYYSCNDSTWVCRLINLHHLRSYTDHSKPIFIPNQAANGPTAPISSVVS